MKKMGWKVIVAIVMFCAAIIAIVSIPIGIISNGIVAIDRLLVKTRKIIQKKSQAIK